MPYLVGVDSRGGIVFGFVRFRSILFGSVRWCSAVFGEFSLG